MKNYIKIIAAIVFISQNLSAQGEAALPFLQLPQSIESFSLGFSGVSNVTNDPAGFYFNPAMLGAAARTNHISIYLQPSKTDWLGKYSFNLTSSSYAVNIGYNLSKELGHHFSLGAGFIHNRINYGNSYMVNGSAGLVNPESYDKFDCFSIGFNVDYIISLSFGASLKHISSQIANPDAAKQVTVNAYDYGILAELSSKKIFPRGGFINFADHNIRPILDLSAGYSISNIGSEIFYVDETQKGPIPRTAKLGYSIKAGSEIKLNCVVFNLFDYTFTGESSDILVEPAVGGSTQYDGMFGKIRPYKNLIKLENDDNVTVSKGHSFSLLETFKYMSGRLNGPGYDNRKSSGYVITSAGLFKYLGCVISEPTVKYFLNHFIVSYSRADIFKNMGLQTKIEGLNISFHDFVF